MKKLALGSLTVLTICSTLVHADQVVLDDQIVDGSICAGQDCVNGESFGFDTIRLKENNLRIKFQDTSSTSSFPSNDWQITANDSSNGGANKFSIDDIDSGRTPFTIEAGAPSNSLYVDDAGKVGIGTSTPVVELHIPNGDTPTLRLEQDGSSGFTAQTWDVAGNETNFFIRDATNGSTLPFKIRPGAPHNSLYIDTDGDIGIGIAGPSILTSSGADASIHVRRTDGAASILVEEDSGSESNSRTQLELRNNGTAQVALIDESADGGDWRFQNFQNAFRITAAGTGGAEMTMDTSGNVVFRGTVSANGGGATLPDYVFEKDYKLMPLDSLKDFIQENNHLPNIPSQHDVANNGHIINMTSLQYKLLEKIEELTLYTLKQQEIIEQQGKNIAALQIAR